MISPPEANSLAIRLFRMNFLINYLSERRKTCKIYNAGHEDDGLASDNGLVKRKVFVPEKLKHSKVV